MKAAHLVSFWDVQISHLWEVTGCHHWLGSVRCNPNPPLRPHTVSHHTRPSSMLQGQPAPRCMNHLLLLNLVRSSIPEFCVFKSINPSHPLSIKTATMMRDHLQLIYPRCLLTFWLSDCWESVAILRAWNEMSFSKLPFVTKFIFWIPN